MPIPVRAGLVVVVVLAGCSGTVLPDGSDPAGTATTARPIAVEHPQLDDHGFVPSETHNVTVTEVVDGDTVDIRFPDGSTDTVRLLGVDTPEVRAENDPAEFDGVPETAAGRTCLRRAGENATAVASERLEGAYVVLKFDPKSDRRGSHGRLLAYVYADGRNLNYRLVAAGRARVYDSAFTFREAFAGAQRTAIEDRLGLWRCRDP